MSFLRVLKNVEGVIAEAQCETAAPCFFPALSATAVVCQFLCDVMLEFFVARFRRLLSLFYSLITVVSL